MKELILSILIAFNVSVGRCADQGRVRRLIGRLRPVLTDKKLIRVGGDEDGGYLVPDDIDGIVACFSPGVGPVAAFEGALASRGINCYLADGSVAAPPTAG